MASMVAGGNWAVTGHEEVEDAPEVKAIQGATEGLCQPVPKNEPPSGRPHWGCCQEMGRLTKPSVTQKEGHF